MYIRPQKQYYQLLAKKTFWSFLMFIHSLSEIPMLWMNSTWVFRKSGFPKGPLLSEDPEEILRWKHLLWWTSVFAYVNSDEIFGLAICNCLKHGFHLRAILNSSLQTFYRQFWDKSPTCAQNPLLTDKLIAISIALSFRQTVVCNYAGSNV